MCTRRRSRGGRIVAQMREQERRLHRSRAERVDANALSGELHAELAAHREDGALRRGVRDLRGRCAEERDERGDVDDGAAAALEQVRDAVLAAEVDALRVHGLDAVPRVGLGLEDRRVVAGRDAGVVVEDVDAAEALLRRVVHRAHAVRVGDVDLNGERVAASAAVCSAASALTSAAQTCAPSSLNSDRRFAAHAAAGAGDDRDLSVETSHQPVAR